MLQSIRMLDVRARVLAVDVHPLPYFTVRIAIPEDYPPVVPGQFVMVQVGSGLEPYLRRAFSIYDLVNDGRGRRGAGSHPGACSPKRAPREMRLLGKVIGRGTGALGSSRAGDELSILGPLGRGFGLRTGERVALVAGGVGSAALLLLARELAGIATFDVFYGGRGRLDLPDAHRFARLAEQSGGELHVTTEDGSAGRRGLVTEPLTEGLAAGVYGYLYACGPMGLLERLAALAAEHGVAGEAALETPMGCGFGACLGCAVPHVRRSLRAVLQGRTGVPLRRGGVVTAAQRAPDLRVKLGALELENPILTASGTFGYGLEFAHLVRLDGSAASSPKACRRSRSAATRRRACARRAAACSTRSACRTSASSASSPRCCRGCSAIRRR